MPATDTIKRRVLARMAPKASDSTIYLQGLGNIAGKPAGDLKIGDVLSWNNAPLCSTVTKILRETAAFIWIEETSKHDGKTYERKIKKDRIVAA